jgi:hypothetical protein
MRLGLIPADSSIQQPAPAQQPVVSEELLARCIKEFPYERAKQLFKKDPNAPGESSSGDSDEADRHSDLIAITVSGWIRSVVGAKRRWRMDFPESDRDRQACCC